MNKGRFKLYTASAGSGKTYTLVKEFLALSLSSDNVSCKDILAVTFTNKAANEMKAKILYNLDGFLNDNPKCAGMKKDLMKVLDIDENSLKKRAVMLYDYILHNYSDFNVSTIDGFVQQVSRSFSKELNLPAQYRVLLDDDDLLDGMIQRIDSLIGKDDSVTEILNDFVSFRLDEESSARVDVSIREFVTKLLKENAYKKGESFNVKEFSGDEYARIKLSLNDLYNKSKNGISDIIRQIKDLGIADVEYFGGSRGLPAILAKIDNDVNAAPSSVVGLTVKKIFDGEKEWYSKNVSKYTLEKLKESGIDLLSLYKRLVEEHKRLFLVNIVRKNLYLYALRGILLNVINQHIEETNKVHISEFNKRVSDILGDCSIPFIYEKLGSRYKHFFIDEFQDTSLLQWHNFLPLVNNGLSENNMSLIVGDAKQAIYRFRNGEVEQIMNLPSIYAAEDNEFYAECENTFKNTIRKESLDCNYRSKKNVIGFNNSFFKLSRHRLSSECYRKVYEDDMEQKCPKEYSYDGFVSVQIFDTDKLTEGKSEKPNQLYKDSVKGSILNDIKQLRGKGFDLRDIAILVRSNSDGADIADFLTKNGVPVISSDSILLKSSDKVRLLMLTLKYLIDDKNDVTRLALSFYKNICTDVDSYDIKKALTESLDKDEIDAVRTRSYSIYDLCYGIIKMYGFNVVEDVFLQYFMNHVMEWQNTENDGVDAFVEHWEKKSDTLYVKITSEIDAVQIMTIHKSKGLEFKVVMYPYAYTKVPGTFKGNEKWLSSDDMPFLKDIPNVDSFILPINKGLIGTDMECHYNEELEKAAFDDFNIMYVAMTRPVDALLIYTNGKSLSDDEEKSDDSYNFFTDYFNAENGYYLRNSNGDIVNIVEKEDVDYIRNFRIVRNECSVKYELGDILNVKDESEDDSDEIGVVELHADNVPKSLDWTKVLDIEPDPTMFWSEDESEYLPQERGNLIHEILSKINTIEDAAKVLRQYVDDGCIDKQQAEKLQGQFEQICNADEIKAAYSEDAVIRNEMEILVAPNNEIRRPDRYAELDDKVILIDYKTGKHHDEYEDKQREYVNALQDMGVRKEIEAYLVYIGDKIEVKAVFLDRLF